MICPVTDCVHFATITKNNAEIFEILIGQVRKDGEIDPVLGEALRVFGHAETFEPQMPRWLGGLQACLRASELVDLRWEP